MNKNNEWYKTFFEGLWLDIQRNIDREQNTTHPEPQITQI